MNYQDTGRMTYSDVCCNKWPATKGPWTHPSTVAANVNTQNSGAMNERQWNNPMELSRPVDSYHCLPQPYKTHVIDACSKETYASKLKSQPKKVAAVDEYSRDPRMDYRSTSSQRTTEFEMVNAAVRDAINQAAQGVQFYNVKSVAEVAKKQHEWLEYQFNKVYALYDIWGLSARELAILKDEFSVGTVPYEFPVSYSEGPIEIETAMQSQPNLNEQNRNGEYNLWAPYCREPINSDPHAVEKPFGEFLTEYMGETGKDYYWSTAKTEAAVQSQEINVNVGDTFLNFPIKHFDHQPVNEKSVFAAAQTRQMPRNSTTTQCRSSEELETMIQRLQTTPIWKAPSCEGVVNPTMHPRRIFEECQTSEQIITNLNHHYPYETQRASPIYESIEKINGINLNTPSRNPTVETHFEAEFLGNPNVQSNLNARSLGAFSKKL